MSTTQDPIEAAILHGVDAAPSSYREDVRAAAQASDSAPNTDDELGSDLANDSDDDLYHDDDAPHTRYTSAGTQSAGTGGRAGISSSRTATRGEEGASNTGPKGVLRDRQLRAQQESTARSASIHATNRKMQGLAMSSETYTEQVEREKREHLAQIQRENLQDDDDAVSQSAIADLQAKERRREARLAELKSSRHTTALSETPPTGDRYFGHLREVDERGYVSSIDNEDPRTPVVIHIYSKAVAQCNSLTSSLASLARTYPRTKFLQVQASCIGFGQHHDDDDEVENKSLQVLPTLLVYRAGRVVANLVRVDLDPLWGRGREQDVRDLLDAHGALDDEAVKGGLPVAGEDHDDD